MPRARNSSSPLSTSLDSLDSLIHTIRGERVILDADLARLYGVGTKVLNQAVKRNRAKFPPDFLLQLTRDELLALNRSQFVTGSTQRHRDPRSRPFAFTEHGALMAANLLKARQTGSGFVVCDWPERTTGLPLHRLLSPAALDAGSQISPIARIPDFEPSVPRRLGSAWSV